MQAGDWRRFQDSEPPSWDSYKTLLTPALFGSGGSDVFQSWTSTTQPCRTGRCALDQRIFFRGGGHHYYEGNDILEFSLQRGAWKRVSPSGHAVTKSEDVRYTIYDDGTPGSAHHYGHLTWAEDIQAIVMGPFLSFGNPPSSFTGIVTWDDAALPDVGDCSGGVDAKPVGTRCRGYTYVGNLSTELANTIGIGSAWSDRCQKIVIWSANRIFALDTTTWTLTALGTWPNRLGETWTAWSDELRVLVASAFEGDRLFLARLNETCSALVTPAETHQVEHSRSHGVSYRTTDGYFYRWGGKRQMWTLDPDLPANGWQVRANLASTEAPSGGDVPLRIFNKFHYIPELDVFLAIGAASDGVWVYQP
ncbi:MAG: hypothetical protein JRH20_06750 [Deltaproteobacteria bacterium]|nr:hypothetical protein [Deltaproteobacteria bacterium]